MAFRRWWHAESLLSGSRRHLQSPSRPSSTEKRENEDGHDHGCGYEHEQVHVTVHLRACMSCPRRRLQAAAR